MVELWTRESDFGDISEGEDFIVDEELDLETLELDEKRRGKPGLSQKQVAVRGKKGTFTRKQWVRTAPEEKKRMPSVARAFFSGASVAGSIGANLAIQGAEFAAVFGIAGWLQKLAKTKLFPAITGKIPAMTRTAAGEFVEGSVRVAPAIWTRLAGALTSKGGLIGLGVGATMLAAYYAYNKLVKQKRGSIQAEGEKEEQHLFDGNGDFVESAEEAIGAIVLKNGDLKIYLKDLREKAKEVKMEDVDLETLELDEKIKGKPGLAQKQTQVRGKKGAFVRKQWTRVSKEAPKKTRGSIAKGAKAVGNFIVPKDVKSFWESAEKKAERLPEGRRYAWGKQWLKGWTIAGIMQGAGLGLATAAAVTGAGIPVAAAILGVTTAAAGATAATTAYSALKHAKANHIARKKRKKSLEVVEEEGEEFYFYDKDGKETSKEEAFMVVVIKGDDADVFYKLPEKEEPEEEEEELEALELAIPEETGDELQKWWKEIQELAEDFPIVLKEEWSR